MQDAQQEIKSTVTVNTSDMSARIDVKEPGEEDSSELTKFYEIGEIDKKAL